MPAINAMTTTGMITPIAAFAPLDSPGLLDGKGLPVLELVFEGIEEVEDDMEDDEEVTACEERRARIWISVFCHNTGTASQRAEVFALMEKEPRLEAGIEVGIGKIEFGVGVGANQTDVIV